MRNAVHSISTANPAQYDVNANAVLDKMLDGFSDLVVALLLDGRLAGRCQTQPVESSDHQEAA